MLASQRHKRIYRFDKKLGFKGSVPAIAGRLPDNRKWQLLCNLFRSINFNKNQNNSLSKADNFQALSVKIC